MSLVNRSAEPWGVYVGIPARRVKERSRKLLEYCASLGEIYDVGSGLSEKAPGRA